ncbi:hypothetical protein HWV62_20884, partial [Athelia sp. TMB]
MLDLLHNVVYPIAPDDSNIPAKQLEIDEDPVMQKHFLIAGISQYMIKHEAGQDLERSIHDMAGAPVHEDYVLMDSIIDPGQASEASSREGSPLRVGSGSATRIELQALAQLSKAGRSLFCQAWYIDITSSGGREYIPPTIGPRKDRAIRCHAQRTIWYPSKGRTPLDSDALAQLELNPQPQSGDLFIHSCENIIQAFLCTKEHPDVQWVP